MRSASKITSLNAGQVLRAEGNITAEQLEEVVKESQVTGERVAEILLARDLCTEFDMAKALVRQLGLPYLSPRNYQMPKEVLATLPPNVLMQHKIVPLDIFGDVLVIATYGDLDASTVTEIENETGKRVCCVVALRSDIEHVLQEKFPPQDIGKEVASRLDQLFG
ncbi:MAG TPA: hypothetical protein VFG37_03435 [Planctomycetota bacterium]|jgi:type IV pilus assembly protein PilB|nr:hypothetical protein [Planctomycetota bacterium]